MSTSTINTSGSKPSEIFHFKLAVERIALEEVVRALLGTVLFHRSLGNLEPTTVECAGVTFPLPQDTEVQRVIKDKAAETAAAVASGVGHNRSKRARVVVALYPTPAAPLQSRLQSTNVHPASPNSHSRTAATAGASPSPSTASAAGAAMSSALGWFSASARALATGSTGTEERARSSSRRQDGQSPSRLDGADMDDRDVIHGPWGTERVWEAWVLDFDVIDFGGASGGRGSTDEREHLTPQLRDFSLRSLDFVMRRTGSSVPPITSAELQPFGVKIIVNPAGLPPTIRLASDISAPAPSPYLASTESSPPQPVPPPSSFPLLHSVSVGNADTRSTAARWRG